MTHLFISVSFYYALRAVQAQPNSRKFDPNSTEY